MNLFQAPLWLVLSLALLNTPVRAAAPEEEKLYVAIEGEGKIAVFDTASLKLLRQIDLAREEHGMAMAVAPHNVQVAPDGKTVWVTANAAHGGHGARPEPAGHEGDGHGGEPRTMAAPDDEVLVIDPETDAVVRRIPLGPGLHLAHVSLTPDSSAAYVTAQNEGTVYRIDARSYAVAGKIQAPPDSQPHGLRLAPDGSKAYVALLQGKGIGVLDVAAGRLEKVSVDGAVVQTAATPDGRLAVASLYDTKKLAVYDVGSKALHYIELLRPAQGPVQLYPTPDSRYVYVADQGRYFSQPDGQTIFKVDLTRSAVVWSIKAGIAPHGIVVAKDGGHAYVSNLGSDDLSVIDLKTDTETARLPVGKQPNGISLWNRHSGGTP